MAQLVAEWRRSGAVRASDENSAAVGRGVSQSGHSDRIFVQALQFSARLLDLGRHLIENGVAEISRVKVEQH